jgi:hypothetical protein
MHQTHKVAQTAFVHLTVELNHIYCAYMHILEQINHMNLLELDAMRERLGLSKRKVCERADIAPSTYTRWMAYMRGDLELGVCPHRRSLDAVRSVLKESLVDAVKVKPRRSRSVSTVVHP